MKMGIVKEYFLFGTENPTKPGLISLKLAGSIGYPVESNEPVLSYRNALFILRVHNRAQLKKFRVLQKRR